MQIIIFNILVYQDQNYFLGIMIPKFHRNPHHEKFHVCKEEMCICDLYEYSLPLSLSSFHHHMLNVLIGLIHNDIIHKFMCYFMQQNVIDICK